VPRAIGIGLVGCGSNGQIHADGLAKLVDEGEIRAVIAGDPSPDARRAANRNCRFEHLTGSPGEVVAHPDVEAVLIAGPTATHREAVLAAVSAGKAVMCEKPLAPSFDQVRELAHAVASSGVVAQVGFHSRFNPMFARLREMVADGELGAPLGYMLREDQFWPTASVVPGHSSWRSDPVQAGGGPLLEHTIHGCDLLVWMFGAAGSVSARTRSLFDFGVEDIATAQVEHVGGVIGTITTVFNGVEGREERRLEVFFEQGTVELTGDFIIGAVEDVLIVHRPNVASEPVDLGPLREVAFTTSGVHRRDFIFYQYLADRAFVHAVRDQTEATPGFADALSAHALVDAAYRSAAGDGAPVAVGEPGPPG
jgi:1,5-anhydro-D-fructose reductase (1,5-anhydro-D-mannitol-forming)